MRLFATIYYALALTLHILALPLLFVLSFKHKYRQSIPARFFLKNNPRFVKNGVWFHACSVGEVRSLLPIINRLDGEDINITAITQTGVNSVDRTKVDVRYLPFETFLPFWVKRNKILVVLEAEFWFMLFFVAKLKGAKIVLLNARISDRSYGKYLKMRWLYSHIFKLTDMLYCQSEIDKKRFETLGATNIKVVGNIKLAQKIEVTSVYKKPSCKTIVAASTHDGEESLALNAFLQYRNEHLSAKLIVVPRHPERFDTVWKMLQESGLGCARFSQERSFEKSITLVDCMGELCNIYAIADIVILGGAFRDDVGGHNPLEPANFGCKIITGKHYFNQQELMKYVRHVEIVEQDDLSRTLLDSNKIQNSYIDGSCDMDEIVEQIKDVV